MEVLADDTSKLPDGPLMHQIYDIAYYAGETICEAVAELVAWSRRGAPAKPGANRIRINPLFLLGTTVTEMPAR